jgi:hypothetical protein
LSLFLLLLSSLSLSLFGIIVVAITAVAQRCQLRAWNKWCGTWRRPLCSRCRQGRSPKRREGQQNRISWPVEIISLLGPGAELVIQTTKMGLLDWKFWFSDLLFWRREYNSYEENEMRKVGAKKQFCADFALCAKAAQHYLHK